MISRRRPHSLPALLLPAVLVFGLTACTPKVVPSGYHSSYDSFDFIDKRDLRIRKGPDVEKLAEIQAVGTVPTPQGAQSPAVSAPGAAAAALAAAGTPRTTETLVFVILPTEWRAGDVLSPEDRANLQRRVRQDLYKYTGHMYPPPTLYRYSLQPGDPLTRKARAVYMESAITQVKKGFGPARHLIGFGVGGVILQLEGRLHEGRPDGPVIAECAVRSVHGGNPWFSLNIKVYSVMYCMKYASEYAAWRYMNGLRKLIPGPPPDEAWLKAQKED